MPVPGFSLNLNLPDLWQQEAVRHLRAGRDVIVDAPTGAGKTRIFELMVQGGIKGQAVYTVPTRALANDKRLEWQRKGWQVGIVTGDLSENPGAPVVVATLETQRERLLRGEGPALLVIDEYQMIGDAGRGLAYEMALVLAPLSTQLLLLSGSVGNAAEVAAWLRRLGRGVEVVSTAVRPVPLEEITAGLLPRHAPKQITGFWPRLAAEVLLSGLGPLLIFAPQRREAGKIARQIAAAVPTPDTLALTREQERILGPQLVPLMRQRIAVHHSGMSYQQRAGVIEPLAKAGQLRVVVSTTGLAAGINFSMRSVTITDTRIFDGRSERELAPDELLQMFGRAGRRGLDDAGCVIATERSPRLSEAHQRGLRRTNQLDWPTLLRVMHEAVRRGEPPLEAASRLCASLFSRQRLLLGFEETGGVAPDGETPGTLFGFRPVRREVCNSRGEWEVKDRAPAVSQVLRGAGRWRKGRLIPALADADFVSRAFPAGRLCRLRGRDGEIYGREMVVAAERRPGRFTLTKSILALPGPWGPGEYSLEALRDQVVARLLPFLHGGRIAGAAVHGGRLAVQIDFSETPWPVYTDRHGVPLVEPGERTVEVEHAPLIASGGGVTMAAAHTAVYAWRRLGLIEEDGTPTRRGLAVSCFKGGEGLAVAAALEDDYYPVEELVPHLANLRGGISFLEASAPCSSERLASVCLEAYGAATYEGYLYAGLPAGYGEGVAEVIAWGLDSGRKEYRPAESIGPGDIERARTEWLSLLRQVVQAPAFDWPRWEALRHACGAELAARENPRLARRLPEVPAIQLAHQPQHHLVAVP